jgi:hypothetical protein
MINYQADLHVDDVTCPTRLRALARVPVRS